MKVMITFSVHRGEMFHILKTYGIPQKLLNAIKIMYENKKAKVITPDRETEFIKIVAGVLQGDTLPLCHCVGLCYEESN